jgi:hypothetical protein
MRKRTKREPGRLVAVFCAALPVVVLFEGFVPWQLVSVLLVFPQSLAFALHFKPPLFVIDCKSRWAVSDPATNPQQPLDGYEKS